MNFETLRKHFRSITADQIGFIALGNLLRGDDGAAMYFLHQIQNCHDFRNAHFLNAGLTPENYLGQILEWQVQTLVIVDVADWGGEPGAITFLSEDLIDQYGFDTHTYSIRLIEQYLNVYRPVNVEYLAIQPLSFDFRRQLSRPVVEGIDAFFESGETEKRP